MKDSMHYSLIIIGAHNGEKTEALVKQAATLGQVLLIEPVPWLFDLLKNKHQDSKTITFLNAAVAPEDGEAIFYAPTDAANAVHAYGDQLGSLNATHAVKHDVRFSDTIQKITTRTISFSTLFSEYHIDSIDTLITDTEGYDAKILATFPFQKLKPRQILFEHKHSDGVFHIGKTFAHLLVLLEAFGFKTKVIDLENCLSVRDVI